MKTLRTTMMGMLLAITLGTQSAMAFYNPQTGMWLSRDPIGETRSVENNLYNFVHNRPTSSIDVLGKMSLRSCKCCCCAENISIGNDLPYNVGLAYGHDFNVNIELSYVAAPPSASAGGCQLIWKEWSNRPPDAGPKSQWYDAGSLHPDWPGWSTWSAHSRNHSCPGTDSMTVADQPTANLDEDPRTMYFAITIKSAAGCPCSFSSKTVYAKQTLFPGPTPNDAPLKQVFHVIDPSAGESAPPDGSPPIGPPYPGK